MTNSAEKILYRKAALIFEELGFLMPRPDAGINSDDKCTTAIVRFKGPFSGYLQVSLNAELLVRLSKNMLGDENAAGEEVEHDSLREISNVICGNALPAVFGFDPIFHLDAPMIFDGITNIQLQNEYVQIAQIKISFDRGNAGVALFADKIALVAAMESR
jgi:CheY-specific phosphatase CheX